jgi:cyclopropane fatty-acyl-phospholipid synthase-like methyltransferase
LTDPPERPPAWRDIVADGYDRVADAYAHLETGTEWPRLRWLAEVLDRLPDGSRVLELGCGNGLPATAAIAARHTVTGVDVSPEQIARARANVSQAELVVADLLELRFPAGSFDAVVAFYVFDHLPRAQLGPLLARIREWLGGGGLLLFTVEPDDNPGVVATWLGAPMFFSSYQAGVTRRLVNQAGFEILREAVEQQLEGGKPVDHLWILARRGPGGVRSLDIHRAD